MTSMVTSGRRWWRTAEAATWADRAARAPGAHVLIAAIALAAHQLNGDPARAAVWAANVRERVGELRQADFSRSFPITDPVARERLATALAAYGI